jgi:hypothetical protein
MSSCATPARSANVPLLPHRPKTDPQGELGAIHKFDPMLRGRREGVVIGGQGGGAIGVRIGQGGPGEDGGGIRDVRGFARTQEKSC